MRRSRIDGPRDARAVAIQLSGHMRRGCDLNATQQHMHHCRSHFEVCALFVHTWTLLEPLTPHWRKGPRLHLANLSSAACLERLARLVKPDALLVERQPDPPPTSATAPDGTNFTAREMHYGPEREFGWRMNVHGMSQAARLRRNVPSGRQYALSVRLRPDARQMKRGITEFWQCIASLPELVTSRRAAGLTLTQRLEKLGRVRKAPGKELRERSRELFWLSISSCGATGLSAVAGDNCMVAEPGALDDVLGQFDGLGYQRIYARATAVKLPHNKPELQLAIAAKFAGIGLSQVCSQSQTPGPPSQGEG
jgi:hypothetical protein